MTAVLGVGVLLMANITREVVFGEVAASLRKFVPQLDVSLHKGQLGRIATIGGSKEYTGGPFYSAKAALLFGCDLSFLFCAEEAAVPIKSYSPEIMVKSFYNESLLANYETTDRSLRIMDNLRSHPGWRRIHSFVLGPGLGRDERLLQPILNFIRNREEVDCPLVLDADALWMVSHDLTVLRRCERCLLTPNINEFRILLEAAAAQTTSDATRLQLQSSNKYEQLRALSIDVGVAILLKGEIDALGLPNGEVIKIIAPDLSPRRCGGQGDVLAGCLGVALHWSDLQGADSATSKHDAFINAVLLASFVTKRASFLAYERFGRATTTPDILSNLGRAFSDIADLANDSLPNSKRDTSV